MEVRNHGCYHKEFIGRLRGLVAVKSLAGACTSMPAVFTKAQDTILLRRIFAFGKNQIEAAPGPLILNSFTALDTEDADEVNGWKFKTKKANSKIGFFG